VVKKASLLQALIALKMNAKLIKFFALSINDKLLLLLAAFWLPAMHLKLKCLGLQACLGSLRVVDNISFTGQDVSIFRYQQVLACQRSVARASRYGLITGTCLSRSLTLMRLLAHQRIAGRLRVGVNLDNGELGAHAWVEVAGISFGRGEDRYEVFPLL
jgi:hypothetical protein